MNARENLLLNFLVHPGRYDFKKCKTVNDGSSLSYFEVMKGKYEGQRIIYNFYCPFITPNQPHTEIFYCCFQVFMLTQALFTLHLLFFILYRRYLLRIWMFAEFNKRRWLATSWARPWKCFLCKESFEKCNFHIKLQKQNKRNSSNNVLLKEAHLFFSCN